MPCHLFLCLCDFIRAHESDIYLFIEDFEILEPIKEWIEALEDSRISQERPEPRAP